MNSYKKLIVNVIIIVSFIFIGMSTTSVLATNTLDLNGSWWNLNSSTTTNNSDMIQIEGTDKDNEVANNNTNNTTVINNIPARNNVVNNNPGQLADTGLEDWPWLIIAICATSTVFAYNKIKEYRDM